MYKWPMDKDNGEGMDHGREGWAGWRGESEKNGTNTIAQTLKKEKNTVNNSRVVEMDK